MAVQNRDVSWRVNNVPLPEPYLLGIAVGVWLHRMRPWVLPGPRYVHRLAGWPLIAAGTYLVVRWLAVPDGSWRLSLQPSGGCTGRSCGRSERSARTSETSSDATEQPCLATCPGGGLSVGSADACYEGGRPEFDGFPPGAAASGASGRLKRSGMAWRDGQVKRPLTNFTRVK